MTEDFFEKHELSLWIFACGISNVILLLLGGGGACFVVIISIQTFTGELSTEQFGISLTIIEVLMALAITLSNIFIFRGKPRALVVNKLIAYVQITSYFLFAIIFEHEDKWLGLFFGVLPLMSLWLMSTSKHRAFVGYHEALHKDPVGFRQKLLDRALS
ncbi:hypothetical protein [Vibrio tapetis]|uniref:Uncharacterized protein n=1 Tax=Vibrio tapetis subsp. tapetis TaxID=1671868 RepID=A0A2N8ZJC9_9VIBR|nr:hypothetical protein [Vibrio tapetis]SON51976.1 conserved membrane protein of unknown function [Vibrio tapetis subsp. tapetis]